MNGNCHFLFGLACGSMLALNTDKLSEILPNVTDTPETAMLFVLGGLTGGILPDIDNPSSHIGKLSVPVSTIIGKIQKMSRKTDGRHRGIFHNPTVYIMGLVLSYLYFSSLIGLFTGCLTHIFLDMFNPSGVPFLFGAKRLRLARIPSGSRESIILTRLFTAVVTVAGTALKLMQF